MKDIHILTKKVAIVIPCYNEAASVGHVIRAFPLAELAHRHFELSIYVVDNNSTDNTAQVATEAGAIVISEPRKGKGHALRAGFRALPADIDYVAMLDGDDTYSPDELLRMIEPLDSGFCDVVIGSRLGGSIAPAAMDSLNLMGNKFFTGAVRALYGANVSDVLTGYFAWKKEILDELYPRLESAGFAIEMEMVTKMARLGHVITSIPISYHPRAGVSNLRPVADGSRILWMLLRNLFWRAPQAAAVVQPRKIVFVSDAIYPYMKGGKEKRLYELTTHLARMGYDVHIYTMHWWKEKKATRVEDNVHLHAICGFHTMYHGDRRAIAEGVIFGLACLRLLRVRFDVLDVDHMPFFPILSSWLVCKLRNRKFYGTWHEALSYQEWKMYMGRGGRIASLIEHLSIRLPHAITAASVHTKELLGSAHGRFERVGLVASGFDAQLLKNVAPANVRCDVLYVGRLVKDKRVDQLISAIGIMAKKQPQVHCYIIGDGIEKSRLQAMVARRKLVRNVTFLDPFANAADVYAYMKAAKVFCNPSIREGFSLVTLESLGCGTPVVVSDAPSNAAKRLVEDGINGSIVPCTSIGLAAALTPWISLPQKPDIATRVAEYDWQILAKKQLEVYAS